MTKVKREKGDTFYPQLFKLIESRGWFDLTLPEIAKSTKTKLPQLLERFSDKNEMLNGFGKLLDAQIVQLNIDANAPLKDRMFEILMARFDALQPYRGGVVKLLNEMQRQPVSTVMLGLESGGGFCRSIFLMMEMAGLSTSKPMALFAAMGLKLVYLVALRTWKDDESADLSPTMAVLDKNLDRWIKITRLV